MKLTDKAKEAVKTNVRLKNLLAIAFECSVFTIRRWVDEEEIRLTAPTSTDIIEKETDLKIEDILEAETIKEG